MSLIKARRELVEMYSVIANLKAENLRLQMEVHRLEHALTTAEILKATLETPKVVIFDVDKDLTPRETEVLVRIMAGDSTTKMAAGLFMASSTVKAHVARIYHKLDVHNRGGAAMAGVHMGLDREDSDGIPTGTLT